MKTYIGVDLGGTNVRVARVDADGNVLEVLKDATEAQKGPKQILDKIEHMIRSLQDYEKCEGIGLGIPGPIDTKAGKIIVSNNLPDLVGYPIADHFKEIFINRCLWIMMSMWQDWEKRYREPAKAWNLFTISLYRQE